MGQTEPGFSITTDPRLAAFLDDAAAEVAAAARMPGQVPADAFGPVGRPLSGMLAGIETALQTSSTALGAALQSLRGGSRHAQHSYAEQDALVADIFRRDVA